MDINFFYTLIYFGLPACFHAVLELDSGEWRGKKQERRQRPTEEIMQESQEVE